MAKFSSHTRRKLLKPAGTGSGSKQTDVVLEQHYSIPTVAEKLDVSDRTVRRYIEKGLLKAYYPGGLVRISDKDFRAFLDATRAD